MIWQLDLALLALAVIAALAALEVKDLFSAVVLSGALVFLCVYFGQRWAQ